nr:MAG TPA: hypothetical protein [Caudoviricetes sp.]
MFFWGNLILVSSHTICAHSSEQPIYINIKLLMHL